MILAMYVRKNLSKSLVQTSTNPFLRLRFCKAFNAEYIAFLSYLSMNECLSRYDDLLYLLSSTTVLSTDMFLRIGNVSIIFLSLFNAAINIGANAVIPLNVALTLYEPHIANDSISIL